MLKEMIHTDYKSRINGWGECTIYREIGRYMHPNWQASEKKYFASSQEQQCVEERKIIWL